MRTTDPEEKPAEPAKRKGTSIFKRKKKATKKPE